MSIRPSTLAANRATSMIVAASSRVSSPLWIALKASRIFVSSSFTRPVYASAGRGCGLSGDDAISAGLLGAIGVLVRSLHEGAHVVTHFAERDADARCHRRRGI